MITRRRSQEFHELAEGSSTAHPSSYAGLLDVVGGLRTMPAPTADPAFVAALREQLIAEAETVLAAAAADLARTDQRLRRIPAGPGVRRRNRRLAAAITGLVIAGGSATAAVASQSALPGDTLYPVKRDIESAHAALTFDRAGRGQVLLHSASNRLDETQALSRTGSDPARVDDALDAFTSQAIAGSDLLVLDYRSTGDESSATAVRIFTASSMARLHDLESVLPRASLPQLLQAAQALDQIESVSVQACPACPGPLVTSVPAVLSEATLVATGAWTTGSPDGGRGRHGPHHGHAGPSSGPHPTQVGGKLPPGGITEPPTAGTGTDVPQTIHDLTGGLTGGDHHTLGSSTPDTTSNALDAAAQVGNTVAGDAGDTVGDTVGDVESALPTDVPSILPSLP